MDSFRRARCSGAHRTYSGDSMHAVVHVRQLSGVLEALKRGAALCVGLHAGEVAYWIEPDGRRIPQDVAEPLLGDPRIEASEGGIVCNITQTWRYVSGEVSLYEGVAEADCCAPESASAASEGPASIPV
jgi:hypothetical protein